MKIRQILLLLVALLVVQASWGQEKVFSVKVHSTEALGDFKMYINPLHPEAGRKAKTLEEAAPGVYTAVVPLSANSFYSIVGVKNSAQIFSTLYLPLEVYMPVDSDTLHFELDVDGYYVGSNETADNRALGAYRRVVSNCNRDIWNVEVRDEARLRSMLGGLILAADSIIENGGCSAPVKEYLKLWSYTAIYNNMYSVVRNARREKHDLSFDSYDIIGDIGNSFDCDIAAVFPETTVLICDALRGEPTMAAKIEKLYTVYKNSTIRTRVAEAIIESFLKTYNYSADFEGGLNQLTAVVEKYGIDKKYIADYESRRATIKGTPFPADVQLRDAGGNVVDFSTFKGKYVYIDMWASWCAPCRREIPHLKKLEAELQNKDVVFVSLSIDRDENAWKNSIVEHDLHGYQLIDSENKLGSALNVRGIPFFVIYDKDGCLYMHDAPRPSSGTPLKEMLEGLR